MLGRVSYLYEFARLHDPRDPHQKQGQNLADWITKKVDEGQKEIQVRARPFRWLFGMYGSDVYAVAAQHLQAMQGIEIEAHRYTKSPGEPTVPKGYNFSQYECSGGSRDIVFIKAIGGHATDHINPRDLDGHIMQLHPPQLQQAKAA